jgi:RHS repeat-associated protein
VEFCYYLEKIRAGIGVIHEPNHPCDGQWLAFCVRDANGEIVYDFTTSPGKHNIRIGRTRPTVNIDPDDLPIPEWMQFSAPLLGFGMPATASFPERTATPLGLGGFPAGADAVNLLVAPGPAVAGRDQLLYDGMLVIQARDGNNVPTVSYTRGRDLGGGRQSAGGIGGLLALTQPSAFSPQHFYYHSGGNGNVTSLLDSHQTVAARYQYDPFGNLLASSGIMADINLYRFSSKEAHANSGLYYYGFRFYEPGLQRWINADPIGELTDRNLYRLANNAPVFGVDPFGLAVFPFDFIGPLGPNDVRGPTFCEPGWRPSGWKADWPSGVNKRGPFTKDPNTGVKWYPHREDEGHWPHYDSDKGERFPKKCRKPWPRQRQRPYGDQSPTNPWPSPPSCPPKPRWWEQLPPIWRWPVILPPPILIDPRFDPRRRVPADA